MKYKTYDLDRHLQIDFHVPGTDEKVDQYVIPKESIDIFMLLKNAIDDEVKRLHSVIHGEKEYVKTPFIDILNTVANAITEYQKIDKEFTERRSSNSISNKIDVYKR